MVARGGQPRVPTAEAEPDGEDRGAPSAVGRAQVGDSRCNVTLYSLLCRLLDVRHVVEVVVSLLDPCRTTEVVDRDCRVASFGEAERQLLVEAMEAAHVR